AQERATAAGGTSGQPTARSRRPLRVPDRPERPAAPATHGPDRPNPPPTAARHRQITAIRRPRHHHPALIR
ncbi:hypothetical protein, partial [Streptomyces sp. MUM 203J]|uniref:hypothetical protein n=1 Tax=Streptomyces sp. MUM 203J TaxID=2791990 RepID=UPI001F0406D1